MRRLETVWLDVPEAAVAAYEAALGGACMAVGFFRDEAADSWRVEGVKEAGADEDPLAIALLLAEAATGIPAVLHRRETAVEGWLARTQSGFPEQRVGRFAIRGTHLPPRAAPGRITLVLDAGVAFGSGEHSSTRGCLRALECLAHRRPRRILDLGTGSGILAMAAARLLHRPVLAVDIEPRSVRAAGQNASLNRLGRRVAARLGRGWASPAVRRAAPYNLVFANILARPLCAMARDLSRNLAPGGRAVLAGLLDEQAPLVLAAHRRQGMLLERRLAEGRWVTLVLRRPASKPRTRPL